MINILLEQKILEFILNKFFFSVQKSLYFLWTQKKSLCVTKSFKFFEVIKK